MVKKDKSQGKSDGSRPLKVGEAIRHALAEVFLRGECHMPELSNVSITVSEVRASPDLKNATVYVMPLGGNGREDVLKALALAAPELRYLVSKKVELRYMPRLQFVLDTSFDEAGKIHGLLKDTTHKEEK